MVNIYHSLTQHVSQDYNFRQYRYLNLNFASKPSFALSFKILLFINPLPRQFIFSTAVRHLSRVRLSHWARNDFHLALNSFKNTYSLKCTYTQSTLKVYIHTKYFKSVHTHKVL